MTKHQKTFVCSSLFASFVFLRLFTSNICILRASRLRSGESIFFFLTHHSCALCLSLFQSLLFIFEILSLKLRQPSLRIWCRSRIFRIIILRPSNLFLSLFNFLTCATNFHFFFIRNLILNNFTLLYFFFLSNLSWLLFS